MEGICASPLCRRHFSQPIICLVYTDYNVSVSFINFCNSNIPLHILPSGLIDELS